MNTPSRPANDMGLSRRNSKNPGRSGKLRAAVVGAILVTAIAAGGLLFASQLKNKSNLWGLQALISEIFPGTDPSSRLLTERWAWIYYDPSSPTAGNSDGNVSIVVFFDYSCADCRAIDLMLRKISQMDKGIRFIFKELPMLGPNSDFAARAALAAHKQDKYLPMHRELMQGPLEPTESVVIMAAGIAGLDIQRLRTDMTDPVIAAAIDQNRALARDLRIRSVPAFIIGSRIYHGATDWEQLQAAIAQVRRDPAP